MGNPVIDPKNELTWTFATPKNQSNNTGFFLADLGNNAGGKVAVAVAIGLKYTGDSDGNLTLRLMSSATNNISNAANVSGQTINTTNNSTNSTIWTLDTRAENRYLFVGAAITGTNTPTYPVMAAAVRSNKSQ